MAARDEPAGLRELLWPFGRFHVFGVVLVGFLALAVLTEGPFWQWIGLGGAVVGSLLFAVLLYRDRQASQRRNRSR
jgi:hypothetical protein